MLGLDLSPQSRLRTETSLQLWKLLEGGRIPSVPAPHLQSPNLHLWRSASREL